MRVLYITAPSFFDLDVSLLRELSRFIEIHVMLIVSPQSIKSSAFSIDKIRPDCDIFSAKNYAEVSKYQDIIDFNKWFIANNPDNSVHSCIKLAKKIKNHIKTNHYDLIHTTTTCKTLFFLTPFIFFFSNTLLTVHDPIPHNRLSWLETLFRRKIIYKANKNILLLSKAHLKQFCDNYKIEEKKIFFSSLGTYDILTHFEFGQNNFEKYILFFGRIEPYKGVDQLIDAYKKSELPLKGVRLVIAGKGDINHNKNELPKEIIFINRFIENSELANLISHCRFVILPYLSATQSGCVMSAFAFNKPILATDVGDFPLTIEDKKTGIICKSNNIDALCDAMNEMERANLNIMEENIKNKYQKNGIFSWTQIAKKMHCVYKDIMLSKSENQHS